MSHEQNQGLINALAKCAAECSHCFTACLGEQDVKMLARCIKLDVDCAEICKLAISFVSRGSEHSQHILNECAEICMHMEHCIQCAEACRLCAEQCHSGVAA
jgi:hypothetical protein